MFPSYLYSLVTLTLFLIIILRFVLMKNDRTHTYERSKLSLDRSGFSPCIFNIHVIYKAVFTVLLVVTGTQNNVWPILSTDAGNQWCVYIVVRICACLKMVTNYLRTPIRMKVFLGMVIYALTVALSIHVPWIRRSAFQHIF